MKQIQTQAGVWNKFRYTFIGDRAFYKTVLAILIPVIIQNTISNVVNLLDNIMVGQVGNAQMSGVAIVNQLIFVFNLTIFGGLAGSGIFGAQFYGAGNNEGLRHILRIKLWTAVAVFVAATFIFLTAGDPLISFYLTGEGNKAEAAAMLLHGRTYLKIMLWGLLPFALSQVYSTTLRETGETMLPMKASLAAVLANLCLNYILIYGKLGFPVLGVAGAAIATVISRYVELAIILIYTHRHTIRFPFISGLYRSLKVPRSLVFTVFKKGLPLLANELMWSLSVTTLTQIFSTCSLNVVSGLNISSTISNLFNFVFLSVGTAVAVMSGQALGAGETDRAKKTVWKLIFFCVCISVAMSVMLMIASPFIPLLYNTTADVRKMATHFMRISAVCMVFHAVINCCYFAMRSGGKTFITFLFDSAYSWGVSVPFAYVLTHFSGLDIFMIYPLVYFISDAIKSIIGVLVVRTGYWAKCVVKDTGAETVTA